MYRKIVLALALGIGIGVGVVACNVGEKEAQAVDAKPKMEYIVLSENDASSLEAIVNKKLNEGFEPVGGVSATARNGITYCQAMIKR